MPDNFHIPDDAPLPDIHQGFMPPVTPAQAFGNPDPWIESERLRAENQVLRELLDLFEHYCEFRLGVQHAIQAKDIPNMRDINKARKLLGLKEIATRSPA